MVEPQRQISYRPVRVVGALLLLQLVGLVGIGVYLFSSIDWDRLLTLTCPERDFASLPVFLPRPATRVRLPDHRLLHLDGLVPELPKRASRVPLQENYAGERGIGDRAWGMN
jgi:hypothetical protein